LKLRITLSSSLKNAKTELCSKQTKALFFFPRFENIHYQVDFLELFDGPVGLKQDDPNLIRFIRQTFLKTPNKMNPEKSEVASDYLYKIN
jgi:hypothetical protein